MSTALHTSRSHVRFHVDAIKRGIYGLQPIGTRQLRMPTIPEVVRFETCHAIGAYSAVNTQVPPGVPIWQYIDPGERAAAAQKCANRSEQWGRRAYEIWIKNDPARVDGFVGDTHCTIRSRDGAFTPMKQTTDRGLVEWNLRDFMKCNPSIASHYEIREVAA